MLHALRDAITRLPDLLRRKEAWRSTHVTYHPPRVERLWIPLDDGLRLFLHRIHPCENTVLYHPHPWPSAVRIISGRYLHEIGDENGPLATMVLARGSEYEMTDPRTWHSVRPLDGPSDSVMIIGKFHDPPPTMPVLPEEPQGPLEPDRFEELLVHWAHAVAKDRNEATVHSAFVSRDVPDHVCRSTEPPYLGPTVCDECGHIIET